MASFECIGTILNIKYLPEAVLVFLEEYKKGYRKTDGTVVPDKCVSWKVVFKPYFRKYINDHFNIRMVVKVKGDVLPYAVDHGEVIDGCSVIGETINLFALQPMGMRNERRMVKDSLSHVSGEPDPETFNQPDF